MNAISINMTNKTIVITKTFEKAAREYGSEAYEALKNAQNDNPSYKVVIRKTNRKENFKGLTYDYMTKYIKAHNANLIEEFNNLTSKFSSDDGLELAAASYGEVKTWFLGNFPEIEDFYSNRAKSIEKASKARKAAKATRAA